MVKKLKIVKKKRNLFNRFECDRHARMGVIILLREVGEDQGVLIVGSEEDTEGL